jgi:Glycosyl transferase 4-like domain
MAEILAVGRNGLHGDAQRHAFTEPMAYGTKIVDRFPRLLYIGAAPVEASYHGSALLYRLLQRYPVERLCIAEAGVEISAPARRLPEVRYESYKLPWRRLTVSRFAPLFRSLLLLLAAGRARRFKLLVREFRPQAILSVTADTSFITAAAVACQVGIPFYLICHDEWFMQPLFCDDACKDRIFGKVYRAAASRLCISPAMVENYERRYQARGSVLYPSRAADALVFDEPPSRLDRTDGAFTCAYAGSFNTDYVAALRLLAECLLPLGGRLLIYGPLDGEQAESFGLTSHNIEIGGPLPSRRLIEALRERADVLFVPMSFAPDQRSNTELSFPSKLTDYTAAGLPLLIFGPSYCSAALWALANAPVAEVVTVEGEKELSRVLQRLSSDRGHRMRLAQAAILAGKRYFSHGSAYEAFRVALCAGNSDDTRADIAAPANGIA